MKKLLIIVDGIDCSGKGYLLEKLTKKVPRSFLMKILDKPKDESDKEKEKIKKNYWKVLEIYDKIFSDETLFLDRFFVSEMVYSIKRGYDAIEDSSLWAIEKYISNLNHLYIQVVRDKNEIVESFRTRGEDFVKENEIDLISQRYESVFNNLSLNKIQITSNEIEKALELIKELKK